VVLKTPETILSNIKAAVQSIIPAAEVFLFGSRAYGVPTDESDWDILILTRQPVTPALKKDIHNAIFPISVQFGAFINTILVEESDWLNNPSYYCLHQTTQRKMVLA
jgi:predicted nucleotidyltransferase